MKSSAFMSVYIENCRRNGHRFKIAGSDKTPLKRNVICLTCSEGTGKTAFAAYGVEQGSSGTWRRQRNREPEQATEDAE